jgi:hypothetical protein
VKLESFSEMATGFSAPGKIAGQESTAQKTANFRRMGYNRVGSTRI